MSGKRKRPWVEWFDNLDRSDKRQVAVVAIERLIELDEIAFRSETETPENKITEACLYWSSCGEDLRHD